jgi:hypothetical protein
MAPSQLNSRLGFINPGFTLFTLFMKNLLGQLPISFAKNCHIYIFIFIYIYMCIYCINVLVQNRFRKRAALHGALHPFVASGRASTPIFHCCWRGASSCLWHAWGLWEPEILIHGTSPGSNRWRYRYPLVNSHITMERSTMLSMGKSTISTGPFSIANC